MAATCWKCGVPIGIGADGRPYCDVCKVRLGYVAHSLLSDVRPGPQDYYQKQLDEPILDTWVYETYGKAGVEYDERDNDRNRERVETKFCAALVGEQYDPKRKQKRRAS